MTDDIRFTLAIESAIGGGSISLFDGDREVANWVGKTDVLRAAEDLLPEIEKLLDTHGTRLMDIGLLAVSAGPGSFTGIRIGIATGLGLKTGLGIPMASKSALQAMAYAHNCEGELIVAVPAGRNAVCWQRLERSGLTVSEISQPAAIAESELDWLAEHGVPLVAHSATAAKVRSPNVMDFGTNIALAIGIYCRRFPDIIAEPLFVSKSF